VKKIQIPMESPAPVDTGGEKLAGGAKDGPGHPVNVAAWNLRLGQKN